MTPPQAAAVRHVISLATAGRYTLGMDLPHHWRTWNFIGMALWEPVLSLAIEGEEGYDPRVYRRGVEVARDYLTYSISDQGFGKEGIGYQTAGMSHTGVLMLAAANRGDNLFLHPHYQRYFDQYLLWAMQPFGGQWLSEGDLASFPPNFAATMLAKYVFPENKTVDTVFRNHPNIRENTAGAGLAGNFTETLLVGPADPNEGGADLPATPADAPLTLYDPQRGMLITRTGWTPDATVLHVNCRSDSTYAAHDHPDRGEFTLSALGRAWAVVGMRNTETKYHDTLTIDGHGQGYFPPPGRWVGLADQPDATLGVVDTKYCWDWFWIKAIFIEPVEQLKREGEEEYIPVQQRLLSRFPLSQFERDRSPGVVAYYKGFLAGDPRMWGEDSWVSRAANYPVRRAFRTAGLIRGAHPYVLVVDDVQKDEQERLYEWRMICPMSVDVVNIDGNDLTLGNEPGGSDKALARDSMGRGIGTKLRGSPRLLVRGLNINQPALPTLQPNPTLEIVELKKHDDTHQFAGRSNGLAKRLVLPSRSVAPDYKVLLAPYLEGQPLPETTWNEDKTRVRIEWADQKDEVTFEKDDSGLTHVSVVRDGKPLAKTP